MSLAVKKDLTIYLHASSTVMSCGLLKRASALVLVETSALSLNQWQRTADSFLWASVSLSKKKKICWGVGRSVEGSVWPCGHDKHSNYIHDEGDISLFWTPVYSRLFTFEAAAGESHEDKFS